MKVAIIGATGMVGKTMLKVIEERKFPVTSLIPVASDNSVGKSILFYYNKIEVQSLKRALELKPDLALFSAGSEVSKEWAPKFAEMGCTVIDNSSAWRMEPGKQLVVPEVNGDGLTAEDKIIANPNCSTIQMVMALAPIHKKFGIERLVVSTYQAVSGSGMKAVKQLQNERQGNDGDMAYPYPIYLNVIPQCDVFLENGYTKEEMKLVNETRKILGDDDIKITATAVRVPVISGHSESVNLTLKGDFEIKEIVEMLKDTEGIAVLDNIGQEVYPMPIYAQDKDDVLVGRIRKDDSAPNSLNMWIVSDNLRKGAATNAIQIAEHLFKKGMLGMSLKRAVS